MKWIIAHGDTDGICSAAIALSAYKNAKLFFSHPTGLADDLMQVDGDVIICDIALSSNYLDPIMKEMERIASGGNKILYIDHHPLPAKFYKRRFPGEFEHSLNSCAAVQTYNKLDKIVPKDMSRVAIYGAIGDYLDRTYEAEKLLKFWEKRELYLECGILIQAIESGGRNYDFKREVAYFLSNNKIPSSDEGLVKKAISAAIVEEDMRRRIKDLVKVVGSVAYVLDLDFSLGKSAVYANAFTEAVVGIGAESRKGFIEMSLRTQSEAVDLNIILAVLAHRIGGSGGGHPKAAGARIPKEKFQQFISELDNLIIENLKRYNVEY